MQLQNSIPNSVNSINREQRSKCVWLMRRPFVKFYKNLHRRNVHWNIIVFLRSGKTVYYTYLYYATGTLHTLFIHVYAFYRTDFYRKIKNNNGLSSLHYLSYLCNSIIH